MQRPCQAAADAAPDPLTSTSAASLLFTIADEIFFAPDGAPELSRERSLT
jgi:hypothetical protein